MSDLWHRWQTLLLLACGASPLEQEPRGAGVWVCRGLFQPAFHPDALLVVRDVGGLGEISLQVVGREAHDEVMAALWGPQRVPDALLPAAVLHRPERIATTRAPVDADALQALLTQLTALDAEALARPPEGGRDGITLLGELAHGSGQLRVSAWSPVTEDHAEQNRFFSLLLDCAQAHLSDTASQATLEVLRSYLRMEPPPRRHKRRR